MIRRPAAACRSRPECPRQQAFHGAILGQQAFAIPCNERRHSGSADGKVDVATMRSVKFGCVPLRRPAHIVGERPIGQRLGEMDAADLVGRVEIGERARDPQHAMVAAR